MDNFLALQSPIKQPSPKSLFQEIPALVGGAPDEPKSPVSTDAEDGDLIKLSGSPTAKKKIFSRFSIPVNLSPRASRKKADGDGIDSKVEKAPEVNLSVTDPNFYSSPVTKDQTERAPTPEQPGPAVEQSQSLDSVENISPEKTEDASKVWKLILWLASPLIFMVNKFIGLFKKNDGFSQSTTPSGAPLESPLIEANNFLKSDRLDQTVNLSVSKPSTSMSLR